jgi:glucoamylase
MAPKWARSAKDGVGTAYSASSRIWFTAWNGILTEAYYPSVDHPQIRDLEYLVTDGHSFFHEEKRDFSTTTARLESHVLGYRITNTAPDGRYVIAKDVITDPHLPCILQRTTLQGGTAASLSEFKVYVLCAPHLEGGGWHNDARIVEVGGRQILTASKGRTWLALAADVPFSRLSCGYVGSSDGWTDLSDDYLMAWQFDRALDGNVALIGEIDLSAGPAFTLCLAFGGSLSNAVNHLFQSLASPFTDHLDRFAEQWRHVGRKLLPLEDSSADNGELYHGSNSVLLAHEDKNYPGAFIASLSIPWGEAKGDDDQGGYHLVWTRDLVHIAMSLLAAGDRDTSLRTCIYLAVNQQPDGGFPQNSWIDGAPYWSCIQLDEVALPILLAWRLHKAGALLGFDPYPTVLAAAAYLVRHGPVTVQERWEEASGYSPSTLAVCIAALVSAATFARERGDEDIAAFLETHADFLECHVEDWTVTTEGTLHPHIARHYVRINPKGIDDPTPDGSPNRTELRIANRPPGTQVSYPASQIVDAGFLELVRYGVRSPDDAIVVDSLAVVDRVLKVETPFGPCWRRYNHDGYGQREDGGPFEGWGRGRAWPLLTGERGHYELAAGRDPTPYIAAMERFASSGGLLPEQVWDEESRPEIFMWLGLPTGSAMPLMWAHAEYLKLLRSTSDGKVFDAIPEVAARYQGPRRVSRSIEVWKPSRLVESVKPGQILRVQASDAFQLRWTSDEWQTAQESVSQLILGISYVDIAVPPHQVGPLRFVFASAQDEHLVGREYACLVADV